MFSSFYKAWSVASAPLSQKSVRRVGRSKPLITWSFWWPALCRSYQGVPHWSQLIGKDSGILRKGHLRSNKRHSYLSGNFKGFTSFVPGPQDKDHLSLFYHNHIKYFYYLWLALITQYYHQPAWILTKIKAKILKWLHFSLAKWIFHLLIYL